jgi:hypothetical protein
LAENEKRLSEQFDGIKYDIRQAKNEIEKFLQEKVRFNKREAMSYLNMKQLKLTLMK